MSLSIFTPIYEILLGVNTTTPEYREGIFTSVGATTAITTGVLSAIFYLALGLWKPVWHKRSHWFIFLTIAIILGFYFSFAITSKELGSFDHYAFMFAWVNAIYAAATFFLFSLGFKRFSIFAKRTPF